MIIHGDNIFFVDICDELFNKYLFNSTYLIEKSEILAVHSFNLVQGDTCCVVGYL